jgi:hypothetical protein
MKNDDFNRVGIRFKQNNKMSNSTTSRRKSGISLIFGGTNSRSNTVNIPLQLNTFPDNGPLEESPNESLEILNENSKGLNASQEVKMINFLVNYEY